MTAIDVIFVVIYFLLALLIGVGIRGLHKENELYRKFFLKGLVVKLFGGISFALVYTYYYKYGGDTMSYYSDAKRLLLYLFEEPFNWGRLLIASDSYAQENYVDLSRELKFGFGSSEWFTVKFATVSSIFGMGNYYSTTLIFSVLSYLGVWRLYQTLAMRYSEIAKPLAYAVLFVPSVFFWGSGIMKDSIVMCFLGVIIYSADAIINPDRSENVLKHALLIVLSSYVILNVKAYVIIALLPAVLFWLVLGVRDNIENPLIRSLTVPVLLGVSIVLMAFSVTYLSTFNDKYSIDSVLDTAHGMQTWHYKEGENTSDQHGRGSSYTLGEYDPTLMGTLGMFGPAVAVTFFRPFLWEVKNVAMLAASIESTLILLFSIYVFIGLGFFRVLKILNKDAFLLMSLSFSLFFGFAVGFTSYNFGALVRYKIPCIPFYLCALIILQYKVKVIKREAQLRTKERLMDMKRRASYQLKRT